MHTIFKSPFYNQRFGLNVLRQILNFFKKSHHEKIELQILIVLIAIFMPKIKKKTKLEIFFPLIFYFCYSKNLYNLY